jgi:hypothetical protein
MRACEAAVTAAAVLMNVRLVESIMMLLPTRIISAIPCRTRIATQASAAGGCRRKEMPRMLGRQDGRPCERQLFVAVSRPFIHNSADWPESRFAQKGLTAERDRSTAASA